MQKLLDTRWWLELQPAESAELPEPKLVEVSLSDKS